MLLTALRVTHWSAVRQAVVVAALRHHVRHVVEALLLNVSGICSSCAGRRIVPGVAPEPALQIETHVGQPNGAALVEHLARHTHARANEWPGAGDHRCHRGEHPKDAAEAATTTALRRLQLLVDGLRRLGRLTPHRILAGIIRPVAERVVVAGDHVDAHVRHIHHLQRLHHVERFVTQRLGSVKSHWRKMAPIRCAVAGDAEVVEVVEVVEHTAAREAGARDVGTCRSSDRRERHLHKLHQGVVQSRPGVLDRFLGDLPQPTPASHHWSRNDTHDVEWRCKRSVLVAEPHVGADQRHDVVEHVRVGLCVAPHQIE